MAEGGLLLPGSIRILGVVILGMYGHKEHLLLIGDDGQAALSFLSRYILKHIRTQTWVIRAMAEGKARAVGPQRREEAGNQTSWRERCHRRLHAAVGSQAETRRVKKSCLGKGRALTSR